MQKRFAECNSHPSSGYSRTGASDGVSLESFLQASLTGRTEFH
jgi:hypothetical protein